MDDLQSVDDFFKELEAKEKDLQISSDLVIEVEDSEFDERTIREFPMADFLPPDAKMPQPAFSGSAFQKAESLKFESEISELKGRISKMEVERVEMSENSQRRSRDFENYKNRTERDRKENLLNQVSNLAMELLPVLDNLGRALECAPQSDTEGPKDFKQFFDGIVLVREQLNDVLADMGVHAIASVGEHFDPYFHEAVAIEETADFEPNVVTSELLRGYKLGEKIVRPAMVKVAASPRTGKPTEAVEEIKEPSPETPVDNQGDVETIEV